MKVYSQKMTVRVITPVIHAGLTPYVGMGSKLSPAYEFHDKVRGRLQICKLAPDFDRNLRSKDALARSKCTDFEIA